MGWDTRGIDGLRQRVAELEHERDEAREAKLPLGRLAWDAFKEGTYWFYEPIILPLKWIFRRLGASRNNRKCPGVAILDAARKGE